MRGTRSRLQRLERKEASDAIRRAVAVIVMPGEDEDAKIRAACVQAGIDRQVACLAIIRISSTEPDFEPLGSPTPPGDGQIAASARGGRKRSSK